jgi:cellulose synthase/poly-beta-1,6-N-acetylglucosamine synthase-like glycosyltransferase
VTNFGLLGWVVALAIFGVVYSYFIYPLILALLPRRPTAWREPASDFRPPVSLIVTAYNEASRIRDKVEECLRLRYPDGEFEIIIASDASDDDTDEIVRSFEAEGVRLVRAEQRLGKENAQAQAIKAARGDILVFSDVATRIDPDGILNIVAPFADASVGAVSSEDTFVTADGSIAGEGLYVRYEMWLRGLESRVNSLVGLSGSFFAARREVCEDWDIRVPSDFNTALNAARLGYRAVTCPQARGLYTDLKDPRKEYRRKVRTVLRGIAAIGAHPEVLNPVRLGLFAFQVFSHKIMRWLVPWFMLVALLGSIVGMTVHWGFAVLVLLQVFFYAAALCGYASTGLRGLLPVKIPYYFVQANVAVFHASVAYLSGKRVTLWTPSAR